MKKITLIMLILFSFKCALGKKYKVSSPEKFLKATAIVIPGDEIVIANGNYSDWSVTINTNGTLNKPIVIRAETVGKVNFSGNVHMTVFKLSGTYTVLSGLTFSNCRLFREKEATGVLIELKNAKFCRITECAFKRNIANTQYMPLIVISGRAEYNRVDHSNFNINIDNMELQVHISEREVPLHTLIENNVFRDKPKVSWANINGGECVQIGQDPVLLGNQYAYAVVRDNRFIACDGEAEVISNKSSGNNYINNYLEDCKVELVLRGGHDCVIDSNTVVRGSGGIRVNGTCHSITNNTLEGLPTGIRFMYGMAKGKNDIGFYIAASDCLVKQNKLNNCDIGIFIGDSKNADWTGKFDTTRYPSRVTQDIAPFNNNLVDNAITNTKNPILIND